MRERDIEDYLVRRVKKIGGMAFKWNSQNKRGVPDRLVFLPGGVMIPVEVKAPNGKLTKLQESIIDLLHKLGTDVEVVYSKEDVDYLLKIYS